jgi:hypothetical protein
LWKAQGRKRFQISISKSDFKFRFQNYGFKNKEAIMISISDFDVQRSGVYRDTLKAWIDAGLTLEEAVLLGQTMPSNASRTMKHGSQEARMWARMAGVPPVIIVYRLRVLRWNSKDAIAWGGRPHPPPEVQKAPPPPSRLASVPRTLVRCGKTVPVAPARGHLKRL